MGMPLVGYADHFSAAPGDAVEVKISSSHERYRADLVRLAAGPSGPDHEPSVRRVPSDFEGDYDGVVQDLRAGSFARIPHLVRPASDSSWSVHLWIWPTTPDKDEQTLVSCGEAGANGWALRLDGGRITLRVGDDVVAVSEHRLASRTWYSVGAVLDTESGACRIEVAEHEAQLDRSVHMVEASGRAHLDSGPEMLLAAEPVTCTGTESGPARFFNGKIDSPVVWAAALGAEELAAARDGAHPRDQHVTGKWDFSEGMSTSTITDISRAASHGALVNKPTRAMTGRLWDGQEMAWRHAPDQYTAIHFHDDDLDDAEWSTSFIWHVADDTPSGVYAVRVRHDADEDFIPVFVRPAQHAARARVAVLMPTFSYLAYGNEQISNAEDGTPGQGYPETVHDRHIVENRLLSLYDRHSDGSGVCYSSRLRPIINLHPVAELSSLNGGTGGPHQFSADLHLITWLHEHSYTFDIITDGDLHTQGAALIAEYRVVLSGSHSEYWSGNMLDAAQTYLESGGRWMQLSGNNAYWVTQVDETSGTVEVRRQGPAQRMWDTEPGEGYLSTSGERGGLWRHRGRSAHTWLGAGTAAETLGLGRPYDRQPVSFEPRAAWVFGGVAGSRFGDMPCLVNGEGAAGFEIDRFDPRLGSPAETLVLASATDFSDEANPMSEELLWTQAGGELSHLVRADMVLLPYPNGGAAFTPGSISWSTCLPYDDDDNDVSRITRNVLETFLADGTPWI